MKVTAQEEYGIRCLLQLARRAGSNKPETAPSAASSSRIFRASLTKMRYCSASCKIEILVRSTFCVLASAKTTLDWEPGSKWRYGGEGIHIAAYLVEMYSGMSYSEFLQKRIFDPLGMKDTYFMREDVPKNRLVGRYSKDKAKQIWTTEHESIRNFSYFRPDGGLYSTAKDLFIWHQTMLNGGQYKGIRLITDESLNQLKTISCGHLEKGGHMEGCYYGLGFQIVRDPINSKTKMLSPGSYGHGGSGGSTIWIDPTTNVIYILMRNNYGTSINPIVEAFQQTVSDALQQK